MDEDTKPPPCSSQEHLNRVIVSSPSFHSITFVARTCWFCHCQNFFRLTMNCDPCHFLHAGAHRVVCLQTQIVFQNNCHKPVVRLIITSCLMMILITGTFSMFHEYPDYKDHLSPQILHTALQIWSLKREGWWWGVEDY